MWIKFKKQVKIINLLFSLWTFCFFALYAKIGYEILKGAVK